MPNISRANRLPSLNSLTAADAAKAITAAPLGKMLQQDEASWLKTGFDAHKADAGVREAIAAKLKPMQVPQTVAAALGLTLLAMRSGEAQPLLKVGDRTLPLAVDLSSIHTPELDALRAAGKLGFAKDVIPLAEARRMAKAAGMPAAKALKLIKSGDDFFRGFHDLDPAAFFANTPLAALAELMKGELIVGDHAMNYQVEPGRFGNHVLKVESEADLVAVLKAFEGKGVFLKDMTEQRSSATFTDAANVAAAFDGPRATNGTEHRGTIVLAQDPSGNDIVVFFDWPNGYGTHITGEYTPVISLFSLDGVPVEGAPLSEAEKQGYYDNIGLLHLLYNAGVEFTNYDVRAELRDYHFSPLEDTTPAQMGSRVDLVAAALTKEGTAGRDAAVNELLARTFYCAEGSTSSINGGMAVPVNEASVNRGLVRPETLVRLQKWESIFVAAGGHQPGKAELGWQALLDQGEISQGFIDKLGDRAKHLPLKLPPADLVPGKERGIQGIDDGGMLSEPLHVGGLATGMMASLFPRDAITHAYADRFIERVKALPKDAQAATLAQTAGVLGLAAPTNDAEAASLAQQLGWMMSGQLQGGIAKSDGFIGAAKHAMRYDALVPDSQAKVDAYIAEYVAVAADATLSRADLDAKLVALNEKGKTLEVEYGSPIDWKGFIMHVPPHNARLAWLGVPGTRWTGLRPLVDILPTL